MERLDRNAPVRLWVVGNLDLLNVLKTALFCSKTCPGDGIAADRILLLSCFEPSQRRVTAALSEQRSRLVAALADEVHFAHTIPGGKTARLAERISGGEFTKLS